ncbi:hypothetical protein JCM11491_002785 [Sporobolomyces phaffii]
MEPRRTNPQRLPSPPDELGSRVDGSTSVASPTHLPSASSRPPAVASAPAVYRSETAPGTMSPGVDERSEIERESLAQVIEERWQSETSEERTRYRRIQEQDEDAARGRGD